MNHLWQSHSILNLACADPHLNGVAVPAGHHRALCDTHFEKQGELLDSVRLQWPAASVFLWVRTVKSIGGRLCHDPCTLCDLLPSFLP